MNRYAIIENNLAINIAIADPEFAFSQGWVACNDEVNIGWEYVDGNFYPSPSPTSEQIQAQNKQQASTLLLETDWVELPSVSDINNIPYLLNKAEFIDYRIALRVIVVNPSEVDIEFPSIPSAIWINE